MNKIILVIAFVFGWCLASYVKADDIPQSGVITGYTVPRNELLINPSILRSQLLTITLNSNAVMTVDYNGDVTWNGHKIESDDQFRRAIIEFAEYIKGRRCD